MSLSKKIRHINHKRIDYMRAFKLNLLNRLLSPFTIYTETGNSILVLRMDDKLGDSVTATGFLFEIKKNFKEKKLIVISGKSTAQVYQSLDFIDEVYVSKKGFFTNFSLWLKLKNTKFQYLINTSHILNPRVLFLVTFFSAEKKISFANHLFKSFSDFVDIDFKRDHITDRYKKALQLLGVVGNVNLEYRVKLNQEIVAEVDEYISSLRKKTKFIVALNSFAGARLRNFNFKTTRLIVEKILVKANIVVLSVASTSDHKILDEWFNDSSIDHLKDRWVRNISLSSFDHNLAIISRSDLVITPDTAWVHLASALKKKLVAIFREDLNTSSEANAKIWAPFQTEAEIVVAKFNSLNKDDINNVKADEVASAAFKMLGV